MLETKTATRRVVTTRRIVRRSVVTTKRGETIDSKQHAKEHVYPSRKTGEDFLPFRFFLLELPLVCLFLTSLLLSSFIYLYTTNYRPYLKAIAWNASERTSEEQVLPPLHCDTPRVVTAHSSSQLFVNETIHSTQDAVEQVMLHGGAVYPDLIDPTDATILRDYLMGVNVASRQRLPVIATSQRRSFPLSPLEHSILPRVLKGITSNRILKESLEELLGPNPALVALSTIIAEKGAPHQNFHLDKKHEGSHMQFPFTFVPNYALLIPLQDTSPRMGATAIVPGTHYCATVNESLYEQYGFALKHGDDVSPWKAGSGLLYNGQVRHRGSANEIGPTRVVLILTFASKWNVSSQRILPLGSLFALRHDLWGFTLGDLLHVERRFRGFKSWLRSLGIWKPSNAEWGWDVVRLTLHRIANDDYLSTLLERLENGGHAWWINLLMIGVEPSDDDDESERYAPLEYLFATGIRRLRNVATTIWILVLLTYLGCAGVEETRRLSRKTRIRMFAMHVVIAVMVAALLLVHNHHSVWNEVRQATYDWIHPMRSPILVNTTALPMALEKDLVTPTSDDILISSRLAPLEAKKHLYAQANILDYHPGNRVWKENVDKAGHRKKRGSNEQRILQQVQNGWIHVNETQT